MLFDIIYQVTLPLIVMVLAGYIPQRFLRLDSTSLNRFVVYVMTPIFLVHAFSTAPFSFQQIGMTVWLIAGQFFLLLGVGCVWMALCRVDVGQRRLGAFAIAYPNSGNFGLPFIGLALGAQTIPMQGIAGSVHGILIMSVGLPFLVSGNAGMMKGVMAALKSPFTHAVLLGLLIKASGIVLPMPIAYPLELMAKGYVPVAVMMLGVQLASTSFSRDWHAVGATILGGLVVAPLVSGLALWGLKIAGLSIDPTLFKLVVINGGLPVGVLLAMFAQEWGGQTRLAASVILATTALSPFTLTAVIWGLNHLPL